MDEIVEDSRFSHVLKDAIFRKLPKKHVKVKIDKRFQSMFTDKKFNIKYAVDKRGRSVNVDGTDDLKRYYDVSENESDRDEQETEVDETTVKSIKKKATLTGDLKVTPKEKKMLTSQIKKKLKDLNTDYARGEGTIISESSSDEETTEEDLSEMEFEHCWGEIDKDAEITDKITSRLAVCNIDWDRIGAKDLMVLFNSFLPKGGVIHSITIYPSEFGLQRMKAEEEKGPIELVENSKGEEVEESSQVQMEKIRQYQLNRLKYYYAVIVCNSPETADAIYNECDGLDYECSSSKLDLRFIPEDTTFEQAPKEICTALPDLTTYRPRYFVTSALTKAKVDLTWDETDVSRQEMVKSIHNGHIDESSLRKYLACSSSEDEEEDKEDKESNKYKEKSSDSYQNGSGNRKSDKKLNEIEKYKALLADVQSIEKKRKSNGVNMEVTWNLDLEKKANQIIKETAVEKSNKTPFQQYLDKRKEKKKQKKLEKQLLTTQDKNENSGNAFSDDEIPSDIDLNDSYFKEELDAVNSNKEGKSKSKKVRKTEEEEDEETKFKRAELELLMYDQEPEHKHFNMKDIEKSQVNKSKRRKRRAKAQDTSNDDFNINVNDERFSALYTSNYFNIDPSDPAFRPTRGTKELIAEKLRRREKQEIGMVDNLKKACSDTNNSGHQEKHTNGDLSLLVGSVKKKMAKMRK